MSQWKHSLSILLYIARNHSAFSKGRLFIDYVKLILVAYRIRITGKQNINTIKFLNLIISFRNFAELINLIEEIFIYNIYRLDLSENSPVIVDCGSHIGIAAMYFKKIYPEAKVICFEPDAGNFALLRKNIELNKLKNVVAHNVSLSSQEGEHSLYQQEPGSINSTLIPSLKTSFQQLVQSKRLSDYLTTKVDLLKVDIEGSECEVIEDLVRTGKISLVRNLVIEFHPLQAPCPVDVLTDLLKVNGFRTRTTKGQLHADSSEIMILAEKQNNRNGGTSL